MKISVRDIGILPLLLTMPFMFYPKVLDGDTQPWVLIAASIAFFTFRTNRFVYRRDGVLFGLSFICILVYAFRSTLEYDLLRHSYTYLSFIIFWVVCQRENGEYFPFAVKATVVLWFLVGFYQYLAIKMGYQIEIPGRYLAGRMGPPSLTAEASYYGSISMLHLMYLLSEKSGKNTIFIVCAVASVLLSGSLLAMILLIFPLMKLPLNLRVSVVLILPMLVVSDFYFSSTGVVSRLMSIFSGGLAVSGLFSDASLNLRAGNMYFTLVNNLLPSLLLFSPIDFMSQYNSFALNSGLLIETGSNYILPAIGEMIYGSGVFAVLLLVIILKRALTTCDTSEAKIIKMAFIIVCMLNPISISNIFLILYITQKGKTINEGYCYRGDRPGWFLHGGATVMQRI